MNIKYKITEYFDKNGLFDSNIAKGITIKKDSDAIIIKGKSRDLIELADLLVNVASAKEEGTHIHIDEFTLINKESEISEIIIEKE